MLSAEHSIIVGMGGLALGALCWVKGFPPGAASRVMHPIVQRSVTFLLLISAGLLLILGLAQLLA